MRTLFSLLTIASVGLVGCGSAFNIAAKDASDRSITLKGLTFGGQQPIVGMKIYLYAAGNAGYGTASQSLLTTPGGYVTSDANGFFTITGDYATCVDHQFLYLYGVGGNAGGGENSAAALMAPLGQCTSGGTLLSTTPYIWMNEVTTVAAAYALSGWMPSPLNFASDNTSAAWNGVTQSFNMASRLVDVAKGTANTAFAPSGYFDLKGTIPQSEINTLANVLAACVNSNGPSSLTCSTLFANARSGGNTGDAPADTASAMLNIAHNPAANVGTLFGLQSSTPPFQPVLPASPQDWTLSIKYTFANGTTSPSGGIALDDQGSLVVSQIDGPYSGLFSFTPAGESRVNLSGNYAAVFNPAGKFYTTYRDFHVDGSSVLEEVYALSQGNVTDADCSQYTGPDTPTATSFPALNGLTMDSNGAIWAFSTTGNTLFYVQTLNNTCGGVKPYTANVSGSVDIAGDASGNVWVANIGGVLKYNGVSGLLGTYTLPVTNPSHLAIGALNELVAIGDSNGVTVRAANGTIASECNGGTKTGIAIDGADTRWIVNASNQLERCAAGSANATVLSGVSVGAGGAHQLTTDGAGNVWILASPNIVEVIGVSTPVTLPLSVAAATNKIGQRP